MVLIGIKRNCGSGFRESRGCKNLRNKRFDNEVTKSS